MPDVKGFQNNNPTSLAGLLPSGPPSQTKGQAKASHGNCSGCPKACLLLGPPRPSGERYLKSKSLNSPEFGVALCSASDGFCLGMFCKGETVEFESTTLQKC